MKTCSKKTTIESNTFTSQVKTIIFYLFLNIIVLFKRNNVGKFNLALEHFWRLVIDCNQTACLPFPRTTLRFELYELFSAYSILTACDHLH